jgi:pimeloyl-ACP methyl ester carboxylesterase
VSTPVAAHVAPVSLQHRRPVAPDGLFLGGWSVAAHAYEPGLPAGWSCPEQPGFGDTDGRFAAYVEWAAGLVRERGVPTHLAGHSLGGAVAVAVAAREPGLVPRVTAFGPAGLPVSHGLRHAARDVVANGLGLRFGASAASRSAIRALDHPRAALRLAREVERLDLTRELGLLRHAGVDLRVVAGRGDRVSTPELCGRLAALGGGRCVVDEDGRDHLWVLTQPERLRSHLDR